jgi:hypothetical protein
MTKLQTTAKAKMSDAPMVSGVLQRQCACGQHTIAGGECAECGKKQMSLQRATQDSEIETRNSGGVPTSVSEVSDSRRRPPGRVTQSLPDLRFKNDFSDVPVKAAPIRQRSSDGLLAGAGSEGLERTGGGTVNGLLDERLTISPEFDPDLGERRPTSGRFGPGLTPPPMITPAYGTCPSATVVESTIDMTPGGLALGYRTGYGITAIMRVLPGGTNWDATSITERLSAGSTTCPAGWNLCTGSSEFFVGAPRYSTVLGVLNGQRNRFYDFHTSRWNQSRLHDRTQNPTDLNTCQAVCQQEYLCGGNVIGRHTITRTFSKRVDGARQLTVVDVTKT